MANIVYKIRIKKDDIVVVRSGKYKGKSGKVISVHPTDNTVTVEGINIAKKHIKPNKKYPQGGIIEITNPIPVAKVGILDPSTKKPSRIAYKLVKQGNKVRVFAKSQKEVRSGN